MELQTIGQVAKECGVSVRMLRYYEEIGLIESERKGDGAYRVYDDNAINKLRQIIVLRKLRVSVKQISEILNNPNAAVIVDILKQNIEELDDEITTLATVKTILNQFVTRVQETAQIQLALDFTSDEEVLSAIEAISFTKNHKKENFTMETVAKIERYPKLSHVRIVYVAPSTVASIESFVVDGVPEWDAYDKLAEFAEDTGLLKVKPDARTFGFDMHRDGRKGYEAWVTIPDDFDVSAPFIKRHFAGGLYACHARAFSDLNSDECRFIHEWVSKSKEFEYDRRGDIGMYGTMEEQYKLSPYKHDGKDIKNLHIDFMIPIKISQRDAMLAMLESMPTRGETVNIDLTTMTKRNEVDLRYENGAMVMTSPGDDSGMVTKQWFNGPVKIELRAKTDGDNIRLYYNFGQVIFSWEYRRDELRMNDIVEDMGFGYPDCGEMPVDEFVDIEWIIGREIMAVKVNGELRHAGTHYPYIAKLQEPDFELCSPVRVGAAWGSTVTVESLRVTEL